MAFITQTAGVLLKGVKGLLPWKHRGKSKCVYVCLATVHVVVMVTSPVVVFMLATQVIVVMVTGWVVGVVVSG